MYSLSSIVRTGDGELPGALRLLGARIFGETAASPEAAEAVGRVEGAVVNDERQIVFFIVRLWRDGEPWGQRALVPLAAVRAPQGDSPGALMLEPSWRRDHRVSQPVFADGDHLPDSPVNSGEPALLRWTLVVPRSAEINPHHAISQALLWGLATAGITAFACVAAGAAEWVAPWSALFLGTGAAIAGYMNGAARDTVVHASEFPRPAHVAEPILALEAALRTLPGEQPALFQVTPLEVRMQRAKRPAAGQPVAALVHWTAGRGEITEHGERPLAQLRRLLNSDGGKQRVAFDVLRMYLGIGLFVRGIVFIRHPEWLDDLLRSHQFVMVASIQHYVALGHLAGGLLLAMGLLTRVAAIVQVPALLGAVLLMHLHDRLFSTGQALEFSMMVCFMLAVFAVAGGGPLSLDAWLGKPAHAPDSFAPGAGSERAKPGQQAPAGAS